MVVTRNKSEKTACFSFHADSLGHL